MSGVTHWPIASRAGRLPHRLLPVPGTVPGGPDLVDRLPRTAALRGSAAFAAPGIW
ncbi:hypothetical protein ACFV0L_00530 [Streptosporangium canum]|uniref:hypothetical protein n=1 Tax=Streptosporangium canum TaxID=324952 RepID=UPI0036748C25